MIFCKLINTRVSSEEESDICFETITYLSNMNGHVKYTLLAYFMLYFSTN